MDTKNNQCAAQCTLCHLIPSDKVYYLSDSPLSLISMALFVQCTYNKSLASKEWRRLHQAWSFTSENCHWMWSQFYILFLYSYSESSTDLNESHLCPSTYEHGKGKELRSILPSLSPLPHTMHLSLPPTGTCHSSSSLSSDSSDGPNALLSLLSSPPTDQ